MEREEEKAMKVASISEKEFYNIPYGELRKCEICKKYCDKSNNKVIIKRRHYHKTCMDWFWLVMDTPIKHEIIDEIFRKQYSCSKLCDMISGVIRIDG
jgi:hypothetical protein